MRRNPSAFTACALIALLTGAAAAADATATAAATVTSIQRAQVPSPVIATMQKNSGGNPVSGFTLATSADGIQIYTAVFTKDGRNEMVSVAGDATLIAVTPVDP
jgi:hypothetical protein